MNHEEKPVTALVAVEDRSAAADKSAYWGRVSRSYTVIWRVLLIALLLFAALFMLLFSRAFTYDSIFCLFKDVRTVSSFIPSDYETVYATYEEGDHVSLPYRGGIAFVNGGGIEVFSPNGKRLLNVDVSFKNPRAAASRKYLVAYEQGGTHFSVTNSYAELYRGETDFPILGVEIADSGHFALITTSDETLSQVLLYDNNFNLIQRFRRASATVDVGLSENGKSVALLGANAKEGTVYTQLDVFELGESEPSLALPAIEGEFPLSVGFVSGKTMAVLTDGAVRFYGIDGKLNNEIKLDRAPITFSINENGVLLTLLTDELTATHRVLCLNKRGGVAYDGSVRGHITAATPGEDEIFLLSGARVIRLDVRSGEQTEQAVDAGAIGLYIVDSGALRIVYPAKAEYLSFK